MRVKINGVIGEICSLPGCSQVGVSHAVYVPTEDRGRGVGRVANENRLKHMREQLGYDYALCTVDASNTAQVKILKANGWSLLDAFVSSKTGHYVQLYGRQI